MKTASRKSPATPSGFNQLAVAWLTMFTIGSDLFAVSPLLPLIAANYGVPVASAGLSVTVFALTYALSAPALGHIADRIGRRPVLIYSLCAFGLANLLTAASPSFTWLLVARFIAGATAAGVSPSVYALAGGSAPPRRRATRMAIVVSGLLMSLAFGTPIGLLTAALVDWPLVFGALGALSLLLAAANSRIWHDAAAAGGGSVERLMRVAVAARLAPTVLWSTALYAMYTYLGEGLGALGYSSDRVAQAILFYGCGAIIGTLVGGRMADRLGAGPTSAAGLAGLSACLVLLVMALHLGLLVDCVLAVLSFSAQLFFPAQQLRLANHFATRRTAILAWNNSALFLGISLGSLIGGQAVSLGGFDVDLTIAAVIALVGCCSTLDGRRRRAGVRIPLADEACAARAG
jgi:predicted MFS family arabinose efflux permease